MGWLKRLFDASSRTKRNSDPYGGFMEERRRKIERNVRARSTARCSTIEEDIFSAGIADTDSCIKCDTPKDRDDEPYVVDFW